MSSNGFEVRGIHHVQLAMPAGEEDQAAEFYSGLLGLRQVPKPEHLRGRGGCWFEAEEVGVHLGVEDPFAPARKAHPALTVDNLSALQEHLERAGIDIVWDTQLDGHQRFYINDCFGNRIELIERAP